ncbi:MAG: hypothetical protein KC503_28720, partial [Myxococcales bacterium]|nr:hypothetical protein [Myxococcales bacterium]
MQEQHSATSRNTTLTWLVFSVSIHVGLGAGLLAMSSDRVSDWLQARARRTQKQALTPSKRAKPITKAAASRAASAQPAPAKLAPAKLAPPATPKDKARRPEQTATA